MPATLNQAAHAEFIVRKSRFLACVQAVANRAEAQAVVAALRAEHPTATHVCWALLAGGQSAAVDDGEPSGTAGRPMLEVLRHHDLEGVLATVVRYFGGVKLGAGGLVRAYTDSVAQALRTATLVPLQRKQALCCTVPYAFEGMVRREIASVQGALGDVQHGTVGVRLCFEVLEIDAPALQTRINDASQGRTIWDKGDANHA